jgi:hypothetical protein
MTVVRLTYIVLHNQQHPYIEDLSEQHDSPELGHLLCL